MSFCMQLEKLGHWLLREVSQDLAVDILCWYMLFLYLPLIDL